MPNRGFVDSLHAVRCAAQGVDGRVKPGHDVGRHDAGRHAAGRGEGQDPSRLVVIA
jgi:hypothetical protein